MIRTLLRGDVLLRIGLVAPDTPFNRRAKAYADTASRNERERKAARKKAVTKLQAKKDTK